MVFFERFNIYLAIFLYEYYDTQRDFCQYRTNEILVECILDKK